MRLATYRRHAQIRVGFLINGNLIDLMVALQAWRNSTPMKPQPNQVRIPEDILDLFNETSINIQTAYEVYRFVIQPSQVGSLPIISPAEVEFLPPIRRPGKLVCVGLNYPPPPGTPPSIPPPYPVLFHKPASALTGHRSPILIPHISQQVEYEAELAVVIGKRGKYITPEESTSLIVGYTIANDLGSPEIQNRSSQWASGKMMDTFCPLGPALVTPDEIPQPQALNIRTLLNEEIVQDGNTAEMIFDIPALVSYLSSLATLEPGDIILTGSPKRAGSKPDPRKRLQPGDVIHIEIEHLGVLTNHVRLEE